MPPIYAIYEANRALQAYNTAFEHALATGDASRLPYPLTAAEMPGVCVACDFTQDRDDLVDYGGELYCADCEPDLHAIVHRTPKEPTA